MMNTGATIFISDGKKITFIGSSPSTTYPMYPICDKQQLVALFDCRALFSTPAGHLMLDRSIITQLDNVVGFNRSGEYIYDKGILVNKDEISANNFKDLNSINGNIYASYNAQIIDYIRLHNKLVVLTSDAVLTNSVRSISSVSYIEQVGSLMMVMHQSGRLVLMDRDLKQIISFGGCRLARSCMVRDSKVEMFMVLMVNSSSLSISLVVNKSRPVIACETEYNLSSPIDDIYIKPHPDPVMYSCKDCMIDVVCDSCSIKIIESNITNNVTLVVSHGFLFKLGILQGRISSMFYGKSDKNILLPSFSNIVH